VINAAQSSAMVALQPREFVFIERCLQKGMNFRCVGAVADGKKLGFRNVFSKANLQYRTTTIRRGSTTSTSTRASHAASAA
ncbi:MAG: hypothetical protein WBA53_06595, partial [Burkholderiaceae bacterium]